MIHRGDLIAWAEIAASGAVGGGEAIRWRVGRVISVSHRGDPKHIATPSYAGSWETVRFDRVCLAPQTQIRVNGPDEMDIDGLLWAVREHTWPGHPDSPRPFDTLDELRTLAAPYRKDA